MEREKKKIFIILPIHTPPHSSVGRALDCKSVSEDHDEYYTLLCNNGLGMFCCEHNIIGVCTEVNFFLIVHRHTSYV